MIRIIEGTFSPFSQRITALGNVSPFAASRIAASFVFPVTVSTSGGTRITTEAGIRITTEDGQEIIIE